MDDNVTFSTNLNNKRYDLAILQSLRKIMRSTYIHSRKLKNSFDVTSTQLVTLLEIAKHETITIAELSKKVHLSSSTLVGIIDRLEKKEWVKRSRQGDDRRKVFISITSKGVTFIEQAPSPLQEKLLTELSSLSNLEQSNIALSLERVVDLMEAKNIDASPFLETGDIQTIYK
ncbi:MAG: MarR family transcriptional regulator [Rickettsiales bacterium]|nr:MarR family transcriptional regulator [Rickettsiales bacterium]|tara:strand:+ start:77 stop:595 length:519 start_codon:yes stop_codon:yes gene_type:complete